MAPDVLLHLVEPAAWRAALADGRAAAAVAGRRGLRAPVHPRAGAPAGASGSTRAGATWCCWSSTPRG